MKVFLGFLGMKTYSTIRKPRRISLNDSQTWNKETKRDAKWYESLGGQENKK